MLLFLSFKTDPLKILTAIPLRRIYAMVKNFKLENLLEASLTSQTPLSNLRYQNLQAVHAGILKVTLCHRIQGNEPFRTFFLR